MTYTIQDKVESTADSLSKIYKGSTDKMLHLSFNEKISFADVKDILTKIQKSGKFMKENLNIYTYNY